MKEFTVEEKKYFLADPNDQDIAEAELRRTKALNQSMANGCYLDSQVYEVARNQGLWSDTKEKIIQAKQLELSALLDKLERGGYDADEAIEDAEKAGSLRGEILNEMFIITDLTSRSADSYADTVFDNYILSQTILNDKKKKLFASYEQYILAHRKNDIVILTAINTRSSLNLDFLKDLPENKVLIQLGVLDEELRRVDAKQDKKEEVKFKPFTKNGKPIKENK